MTLSGLCKVRAYRQSGSGFSGLVLVQRMVKGRLDWGVSHVKSKYLIKIQEALEIADRTKTSSRLTNSARHNWLSSDCPASLGISSQGETASRVLEWVVARASPPVRSPSQASATAAPWGHGSPELPAPSCAFCQLVSKSTHWRTGPHGAAQEDSFWLRTNHRGM